MVKRAKLADAPVEDGEQQELPLELAQDVVRAEALAERYRPQEFSQIFGQDAVLKSLNTVIANSDAQQFLFVGKFGTGKTTMALLTCDALGILPQDILEIDGATNNGIDAMRAIQGIAQYTPFGPGTRIGIIIDEAQRLSGPAWDSLLKVTERPPPHAFWFLCSTNASKIPATIKSRFITFNLSAIKDEALEELVMGICEAEQIELPVGFLTMIVRAANGSARQALANLVACRGLETREEAATILQQVQDQETAVVLARLIIQGGSWQKAMGILSKAEAGECEGIRIQVLNYLASCARKAQGDEEACRFLAIMENWVTPLDQSTGDAHLLIATARSLFPPQ